MSEAILLQINGKEVSVPEGSTVAAALLAVGIPTRNSISGEPRAPLCGMGICYECRVEIDGVPHRRSCMVACRAAMKVRTL
jgi:sarcosine oxidase subunit alpha